MYNNNYLNTGKWYIFIIALSIALFFFSLIQIMYLMPMHQINHLNNRSERIWIIAHNSNYIHLSANFTGTGGDNETAMQICLYFLLVYIYTQDTVSKPSHLGIALIMKDKRSKIKTNEQMIQKMMMLQYCIVTYVY